MGKGFERLWKEEGKDNVGSYSQGVVLCLYNIVGGVTVFVLKREEITLQVMKDFKRIHGPKDVDAAMTGLVQFCEKYGKV